MEAIDLKNITPESIVIIVRTHAWNPKDIVELIKLYGEQQVALHTQKKEPVSMVRPRIKGYWGENITLKQVHDTYLNQPELYNYAQALDNYIDCLEKKLLPNKPTDPKPIGSPAFDVEMSRVGFESLAKGDEFECYGDTYLNYDYPKICKCVKDSDAMAHEKDGISFYLHPLDEVFIIKK